VFFLDFLLVYDIDSNYGSSTRALAHAYPVRAAEVTALPYFVPPALKKKYRQELLNIQRAQALFPV
jgi:hypothetical protein